jgi:hypothetical protein
LKQAQPEEWKRAVWQRRGRQGEISDIRTVFEDRTDQVLAIFSSYYLLPPPPHCVIQKMSAGTLYTSSELESKRVRVFFFLFLQADGAHILLAQIRAIAAFAGVSVDVKESGDVLKTPAFVASDGFTVIEAAAIGRYSE